MKARTRKLAWLLSAAMVFTSVNPGMTVMASEENEVTEQSVEESSEADEDVAVVEDEIPEAEDVELLEEEGFEEDGSIEESATAEPEEEEEQLLMAEEEGAEAVATYAEDQVSENSEITEITGIQGIRSMLVVKEESLCIYGAKITVKYADGTTGTLEFNNGDTDITGELENYAKDNKGNTVYGYFADEQGNTLKKNDRLEPSGTYYIYFTVNGKKFESADWKVEYTGNTNKIATFSQKMELGSNTIVSTNNFEVSNWYYFDVPADGRYHIDDAEQAVVEIYKNNGEKLDYYDSDHHVLIAKKGERFFFAFHAPLNEDDVINKDAAPIYEKNIGISVVKDVSKLELTPTKTDFYEHIAENHVLANLNITYTSDESETIAVESINEKDDMECMYDKYGNIYKFYMQKNGTNDQYGSGQNLDAGTYTVHVQWNENTDIEATYELEVKSWPTPFTDPSIEVTQMELEKGYTVEINDKVVDRWFKYVPEKDIAVVFEASRLEEDWIYDYGNDTYGEIYDGTGKMIASDDQSGAGNQFKVECSLSAGQTYYLRARMHNMTDQGTFAVSLKAAHSHTYVEDRKPATCTQDGYVQQKCSECGEIKEGSYTVLPKTAHSFGAYQVTTAPTALAAGVQTRTCSVCGYKETSEIAKLPASVSLSATSVPLQVKQSVSLEKLITAMTTGDRLVSCSTSNKKIATVSNAGKVTGKAAGNAKITMTFASGITKTVTVKVQKKKVATSKITNVPGSITLKVKKTYKLSPVIAPISTKEKATYKTANKKIATVSKSGKITAKKAGKTTITVKVGKKTKKVKVTVKK